MAGNGRARKGHARSGAVRRINARTHPSPWTSHVTSTTHPPAPLMVPPGRRRGSKPLRRGAEVCAPPADQCTQRHEPPPLYARRESTRNTPAKPGCRGGVAQPRVPHTSPSRASFPRPTLTDVHLLGGDTDSLRRPLRGNAVRHGRIGRRSQHREGSLAAPLNERARGEHVVTSPASSHIHPATGGQQGRCARSRSPTRNRRRGVSHAGQ